MNDIDKYMNSFFNSYMVGHFTKDELRMVRDLISDSNPLCPCKTINRECSQCGYAELDFKQEKLDGERVLSNCRASIVFMALKDMFGYYGIIASLKRIITQNFDR